jgi:hypothetical protein
MLCRGKCKLYHQHDSSGRSSQCGPGAT